MLERTNQLKETICLMIGSNKERISSSLGRVDTILGKFNDDFSRLYPFMDKEKERRS